MVHDVHQPPLRLTRRGRAVVLGFFVLLASLASAVLFTTASRADNQAPPRMVTVHTGDTLWDIATREMPGRNGQAAVAELRDVNHLDGYRLQPGQTLILPRNA